MVDITYKNSSAPEPIDGCSLYICPIVWQVTVHLGIQKAKNKVNEQQRNCYEKVKIEIRWCYSVEILFRVSQTPFITEEQTFYYSINNLASTRRNIYLMWYEVIKTYFMAEIKLVN